MKVLHVHRLRGIGGSERHLLTLLPALRDRGVDARFLGLDDGDPDPFYNQLDRLGVPYERVPAPGDLDPRLAYRVIRATRRMRPDIVHTHLVHGDVYGALAAKVARSTIVSTKHNDDPFRLGAYRHVERALGRLQARIICITHALERFNVERVGLSPDKLSTIQYGLDDVPPAWGPPGGPGIHHDARVLLAISRLEQQKGIDIAIKAMALIREQHPDAVLVVLGSGSLDDELAALASKLGVEETVRFGGRSGDVASWLARAEVFVHPARWEGFGLVLLEAMLAGLPIIASSVSAIPEIVVDGETGLLVPPDDPGRLAHALSSCLTEPARASQYGSAGRLRARASFSVARMAEQTLSVYQDVLA